MIEQFLNRDYLLAIAAAVAEGVAREAERKKSRNRQSDQRRGPTTIDPLAEDAPNELAEFADALREVPELKPVLRRKSSTRPPRPRPSQTELQKEDSVYIPRDPILSIIQSAVEEAVEEYQPDAIDEPPSAPDGRRAGRPVPTITDRRLRDADLVVTPGRRVWKPFEVATGGWIWLSDPRWVFSKAHELWRDATDNFAPFVAAPRTVTIEDNSQIFLVGDWGSGLERALRVRDQIKREMVQSAGRQHVVIHLGDVYYSGTDREFTKRFLDPWPVASAADALSFTLPGNHDMYSGGHAYFDRALTDPRFAHQGGCSYFALRNNFWQILGLDSAYEDAGLHADQAKWARSAILDQPDSMGTILLSHHQPFSAHEKGNKVLRDKIAPALETRRVDAWFWGHEHRCIQYGPTTVGRNPLGFSSCLGHGGRAGVSRDEGREN
jgi:3',5'-cyclic AMP phosphodiesterase CpdA